MNIKDLILNPDLMNLPLDNDLTKIFDQKLSEEVEKYLKEEKRLKEK